MDYLDYDWSSRLLVWSLNVHLGKSWRRHSHSYSNFLREYRQICILVLWFSFPSISCNICKTTSFNNFITLNILIFCVQNEKAWCRTRLVATFSDNYLRHGSRKAQIIGYLASFVWPLLVHIWQGSSRSSDGRPRHRLAMKASLSDQIWFPIGYTTPLMI